MLLAAVAALATDNSGWRLLLGMALASLLLSLRAPGPPISKDPEDYRRGERRWRR